MMTRNTGTLATSLRGRKYIEIDAAGSESRLRQNMHCTRLLPHHLPTISLGVCLYVSPYKLVVDTLLKLQIAGHFSVRARG